MKNWTVGQLQIYLEDKILSGIVSRGVSQEIRREPFPLIRGEKITPSKKTIEHQARYLSAISIGSMHFIPKASQETSFLPHPLRSCGNHRHLTTGYHRRVQIDVLDMEEFIVLHKGVEQP